MQENNCRHPEERPGAVRLAGGTARPPLPPVIGHRGAAARAPENTLAGLRRAKELGCEWVEFDVRLTLDGVPVLCHDPRLERTTDGFGPISSLRLSTVRECDAGSWFAPAFAGERIPTLEEALLLCAEFELGANIEIKADRGGEYATAAAVATTLERVGDRCPIVLVSSFQPPALAAFRGFAPQVPRGILFRLIPWGWEAVAAALGCRVIGADHRRLRPRRIKAIRAAGYELAAYTVNDPVRARRLFDLGVASVFSDMPDIILAASAGRLATRPWRGKEPFGEAA